MCDALVLARVGLICAGPRVAGEADVECVEVVHLHQLLAEPAATQQQDEEYVIMSSIYNVLLPDPPHGVAHAVQGGGEGGEARHAGDHGQYQPADQSELSIVSIDQSQRT